jgi:hypothetical protein
VGGQGGERWVDSWETATVTLRCNDQQPAIAFNQIIMSLTARRPSFCRDTLPIRPSAHCST